MNQIDGPGIIASDAAATTATLIVNNGTAHSTPNLIPGEDGGPTYIGTNFASQYVYDNGASATLAHLAGAPDQREPAGLERLQARLESPPTGRGK